MDDRQFRCPHCSKWINLNDDELVAQVDDDDDEDEDEDDDGD